MATAQEILWRLLRPDDSDDDKYAELYSDGRSYSPQILILVLMKLRNEEAFIATDYLIRSWDPHHARRGPHGGGQPNLGTRRDLRGSSERQI